MEKRLVRSKHIDILMTSGIVFGIGYSKEEKETYLLLFCFVFVIKNWSFGSRTPKPTTF